MREITIKIKVLTPRPYMTLKRVYNVLKGSSNIQSFKEMNSEVKDL